MFKKFMLILIVFMILQSYRKSNCFRISGTPSLCDLPYDKHVIIGWTEFFMILQPLERVNTKKQMMNHRFQRSENMHNITIARLSHLWNALIRRDEWWIVDFKGVKTESYHLLLSCHMGEHKDWGNTCGTNNSMLFSSRYKPKFNEILQWFLQRIFLIGNQ